MNENQMNDEIAVLNLCLTPGLDGLLVAAYASEDRTITFVSYRQTALELATYLKLSSIFKLNNPVDCHVTDNIGEIFRFTITYNLQSLSNNSRMHLVTKTNDLLPLVSLQSIYPAFNWSEREIWDMSGIFFMKHPDLRRILTDYGFTGHPLRKDFPLSGFKEIHYEDLTKQVEYSELELAQNYRVAHFLNPWAGEKKV